MSSVSLLFDASTIIVIIYNFDNNIHAKNYNLFVTLSDNDHFNYFVINISMTFKVLFNLMMLYLHAIKNTYLVVIKLVIF